MTAVLAAAGLIVLATGIITGTWANTRRRGWRYWAHRAGILWSPSLAGSVPHGPRWKHRVPPAANRALGLRLTAEERDPDYCWTCRRKCGSKAHR
ncbi:hypothetical protein ACFQ61_02040 [Streptomyces sp. NPDC056500]|uniref:hypothetical protein n=1 Tax=Streptomyces sp. NPDC056500 TaxID=3345840 RepID=UPI00368F5E08